MTPVLRTRPKIGDVIEITVGSGLAYAQYTHKHAAYGALLRVLPQVFTKRPDDFSWVSVAAPQFLTFFPLGAACSRGIVQIVGAQPLSPEASVFPLFRSSAGIGNEKRLWWLWDGSKEWRIGDLQPGMETLPLRGVINDTLLVKRITEGWRHEMVV
ncbi:hypothetical protein [Rhodoferax aquaticus]|uniref:Uncharacterized protein n=1 Tax=Rhodoferax aquaticus TaxID=2527691 RepID=A0A515EJU3_9BURK|nr:hypothetical protein [Rhodoferax aquaticus]QDL52945.1 hypothetical protein EXZ61_01465 [Rhodoferax aquaticus]